MPKPDLARYAQLAALEWSEWDRLRDVGEIDYATKKLLHLCSWPSDFTVKSIRRHSVYDLAHWLVRMRPGRLWCVNKLNPLTGQPRQLSHYMTDCNWSTDPRFLLPASIDPVTKAADIPFRVADPCEPVKITRDITTKIADWIGLALSASGRSVPCRQARDAVKYAAGIWSPDVYDYLQRRAEESSLRRRSNGFNPHPRHDVVR